MASYDTLSDWEAARARGPKLLLDFDFSTLGDDDFLTGAPPPATLTDSLGTSVGVAISQTGSPDAWGIASGVLRLDHSAAASEEIGILDITWAALDAILAAGDTLNNDDVIIIDCQFAVPTWTATSFVFAAFDNQSEPAQIQGAVIRTGGAPYSRVANWNGAEHGVSAAAYWRSVSVRRTSMEAATAYYDATGTLGALPLVTTGPVSIGSMGVPNNSPTFSQDNRSAGTLDVTDTGSTIRIGISGGSGETADGEIERLRVWRIPALAL